MKYFIIILTVIVTSCMLDRNEAPPINQISAPTPAPLIKPTIVLGETSGLIGNELQMVKTGIHNVNLVLASNCLKQGVLLSQFTENNGLTPNQIWNLMVSNPITVNVTIFTGSWAMNHISRTVGYEYESDPNTVFMNRYYVNSAYMVGDNLIHEGMGHSIGFHHYEVKETSEPYGMNDIYEKCAKSVGIMP